MLHNHSWQLTDDKRIYLYMYIYIYIYTVHGMPTRLPHFSEHGIIALLLGTARCIVGQQKNGSPSSKLIDVGKSFIIFYIYIYYLLYIYILFISGCCAVCTRFMRWKKLPQQRPLIKPGQRGDGNPAVLRSPRQNLPDQRGEDLLAVGGPCVLAPVYTVLVCSTMASAKA